MAEFGWVMQSLARESDQDVIPAFRSHVEEKYNFPTQGTVPPTGPEIERGKGWLEPRLEHAFRPVWVGNDLKCSLNKP